MTCQVSAWLKKLWNWLLFIKLYLLFFGRFRKLKAMWVMAILVVEFSREGYKIRKVFGKESTAVQWNCWILRFGVVVSCQKLGTILENKVIWKLMLSKNVNNKKCSPRFVFFNSDLDDFWRKKITLEVKLPQFAKFNYFIWLFLVFSQKTFLILYPSIENSITRIAITQNKCSALNCKYL